MYENQISHLNEKYDQLNQKITDHENQHPHIESDLLIEWEKQKLAIKDEIRRLERLQWEHDREHVDFDDDR